MAAGKTYSTNLAVLRIAAMVMVLSIHVGIGTDWPDYVYAGQYGVQLFFILSGYLIYASLDSGISAIDFYKKRALRIVPEYWTALILYWLVETGGYMIDGRLKEAVGSYDAPYGIRFLRYFTFTNCLIPSESEGLWNNRNAWWTMSSFMVFYLLAPLFYKLIRRFFTAMAALIALMGATPVCRSLLAQLLRRRFDAQTYSLDSFCEQFPLLHLYCFFLGITLYLAIREGRQFFLVLWLLFLLGIYDMRAYRWECALTLCVMGALQCEIHPGEKIKKVISFLSAGSFSVYCVHSWLMWKFVIPVFGKVSTHKSVNFALVFVATSALCYAYYLAYRFGRDRIKRRNNVG